VHPRPTVLPPQVVLQAPKGTTITTRHGALVTGGRYGRGTKWTVRYAMHWSATGPLPPRVCPSPFLDPTPLGERSPTAVVAPVPVGSADSGASRFVSPAVARRQPQLPQQRYVAVAQLVAAYHAGRRSSSAPLTVRHHRLTVSSILQCERVTLRSRGINPDDLPEVVPLYQDGWALARLASKFDASPSTATNTLRRAGVPIRRPGRPPTSPPRADRAHLPGARKRCVRPATTSDRLITCGFLWPNGPHHSQCRRSCE
jgi:hypothetical protein